MTPDEIKACYRLYAAHRMSHEICAFPEIIPVMNNAGEPDGLGVLLRAHARFEGLVGEVGQVDRNEDLYRAAAGHVDHLRKMLASFDAQLFGRGALLRR